MTDNDNDKKTIAVNNSDNSMKKPHKDARIQIPVTTQYKKILDGFLLNTEIKSRSKLINDLIDQLIEDLSKSEFEEGDMTKTTIDTRIAVDSRDRFYAELEKFGITNRSGTIEILLFFLIQVKKGIIELDKLLLLFD